MAVSGRRRILLSGMVAGDPGQGGATWAVLQYLLGFRELGHEVLLVEPVQDLAGKDAVRRYFDEVVSSFSLRGRAALVDPAARTAHGMERVAVEAAARACDVLVNIAGMLADPELTARVPVRVYLDLDPAFTQVWHAQGIDLRLSGHTHHVTIGQRIGEPDCPVPTCGLTWRKTLQPVVLSHWPRADAVALDAFTTVGNWRAYGSVEHAGVHYGQKVHALRPLMGLPRRSGDRFELALAIHPGEARDLAALRDGGWTLVDPAAAAGTPARYRDFVRGSRAEFGLAKSGYAASRCGWISDRSVCYLASGRPVLAMDTGFRLPGGEGGGLLVFTGLDEAIEGVARIRADYARQAAAARALAEEHFASDRVLPRLLQEVGA